MLLQSVFPISDSLILFCNLRNKWFIYCIVLVFVCIAHYFRDLSYLKLCLNQMICYVLISWTLMSWRTLAVCLLEQLASSMQSFTRVIIGVDALESEFLRIKQLQMMNLQLILTRMKSSCSLIPSGTKNLSKFIYTLVNLLIPHSNLYWESLFSTIRNTCTGGLYSLGKKCCTRLCIY